MYELDKFSYTSAMDLYERNFYPKKEKTDIESQKIRYLALSRFFQNIFISKHGYILDTGNFEDANIILMRRVKKSIERHPILWKLFFMVA